MQDCYRFLGRFGGDGVGRNTAMAEFLSVGVEPSSARSQRKPGFWLSGGEALILVLLVSFGLWAVIWSGVALLAVGGWR
jgi:hypothetical protein